MIILILLIVIISEFHSVQDNSIENVLNIPRNIQSAYENGTRSSDGNPGRKYWQNNSEYIIQAEFDPTAKFLKGSADIIYYNESPDTLTRIVFRLYQDIFKKEAPRDWQFNPDGLTDGIIINKLIVDGFEIEMANNSMFSRSGTNASIILTKPLPPSSSLVLKIEWSYYVSGNRLRTGAYDSTSYFIAYWYPEISVYDDIDGWDIFNYSGTQEFYNDFSSFDVKITLPNSFCLWATGELQNPESVLQEKFLNRYKQALLSDTVIRIISKDDLAARKIFNDSKETNTWHFKAENSTAFAFGLSDHYLWDGISVVIDRSIGKRIFIDAGYRAESDYFYDVAEMTKKVIEYFSSGFPNVEFPYLYQTIFNGGAGGGGMEHPMIVNNGTSSSKSSAEALIAHEIAHQYFPFYVGTNEKKYAFMDEGWAVMFTIVYQENFSESARLKREVLAYQNFAGKEMDIPPMIPSIFLSSHSYRIAAYTRPALAFYFLKDIVGEDSFKNAVKKFISGWNGKHPTPYDMFNSFNEAAGQNLNWFWKPWLFESGYPDLELDKAYQDKGIISIHIIKKGNIPIPINLKLVFNDNSTEIIYHNAGVWKDGNKSFLISHQTDKMLKEVLLGNETIPDVDAENNLIVIH